MKIVASVFVVIAILALLLAARTKTRKADDAAHERKKMHASKTVPAAPRLPYRATSIVFGDSACEAVKAIGNKRFLDRDRDVPGLPLAGCANSQCGCRYAHHDDRRESGEDRRHPSALKSQLYDTSGQANRREKKRGRRKSDWA
ncbi:MAG: hypothetical protein OEW92_06965 [Gammaproteobacteria bacterium]|jgi:hypothetical protein|nr:hypothetical protein [Gammaproteobacteria bacterium]MDH5172141.1 hypothetical protein [Gammaproteobacteria bacterium]